MATLEAIMPGIIVGATIFTYASVAFIFTRYPQLIYGRRKQKLQAPHISHRGGAAERLENTLAAFEHAVKDCRTDMLELDCHLTKDGKVVVLHDSHLLRVTGVDAEVSDFDYDQLPPLSEELQVSFAPTETVDVRLLDANCASSFSDLRRICLLEDVFRRFPETAINLDVKVDNDKLIDRIAELIRQYKRESITVWGNRDAVICGKCYRKAPEIPLIFSMKRVIQTVLLFYVGLLPFFRLREQFFEIPAVSMMLDSMDKQRRSLANAEGTEDSQSNQMQFSWKLRVLARIIDAMLMRRALIEHLRKRGIVTFCWVLNDEASFERAFRDVGVDGVMTDKPTLLRLFLDDHPEVLAPRVAKCG